MHNRPHTPETRARIAATLRKSWLDRYPERRQEQAYRAYRSALWVLNTLDEDSPDLKRRIVDELVNVAPRGQKAKWMRAMFDLARGFDVKFLIDLNDKPSRKRITVKYDDGLYMDPDWEADDIPERKKAEWREYLKDPEFRRGVKRDQIATWLHVEKQYLEMEREFERDRDNRSLPRFRAEMIAKYGDDDVVRTALSIPTRAEEVAAARKRKRKHDPRIEAPGGGTVVRIDSKMRPTYVDTAPDGAPPVRVE